MLRGNNRKLIFNNSDNYLLFLKLLQEAIAKLGFLVHSYCLMPNHVHMIIEVRNMPLSKIMHHLASRYAKLYNHLYSKIGHLFQGRYKALLVHDENHLLDLCRYIHLNPVAAKMVDTPEEYRWSSHSTFSNPLKGTWVTTSLILSSLEKRTKGLINYQTFIHDGLDDIEPPSKSNSTDENVWDVDDYFIESLNANKNLNEQPKFTLAQIVQAVCYELKISEACLSAPGKSQTISRARAFIILLSREYGIAENNQLTRMFGRHIATISNLATRYTEKLASDYALKKMFANIKANLEQITNVQNG